MQNRGSAGDQCENEWTDRGLFRNGSLEEAWEQEVVHQQESLVSSEVNLLTVNLWHSPEHCDITSRFRILGETFDYPNPRPCAHTLTVPNRESGKPNPSSFPCCSSSHQDCMQCAILHIWWLYYWKVWDWILDSQKEWQKLPREMLQILYISLPPKETFCCLSFQVFLYIFLLFT